ncbi:hypothetical protein ACIG5E_34400 [Kitasatospora sp. NPDC053057]|uniref:hypothetical protein n=1 Tax=Kitasatospora sp. NPDC053057 TaxID=3364062 RepID=UPI0037C75E6E
MTAAVLAVTAVPVSADPKPPDVCTTLAEAAMHPLDCAGKALSYGVNGEIQAAKQGVLDDITGAIVDGVNWISGAVGDSIQTSGAPDLKAAWFNETFEATRSIGAMFALIALLCSAILAALTRDGAEVGRTLTKVLTAGVSCGLVGSVVMMFNAFVDYACDVALGTDGWASITDSLKAVAHVLNQSVSRSQDPSVVLLPSFIIILMGLVIIICLGVVWVEMIIRRMAIDICIAFWPLAVSGSIWKKSRQWEQRLIDTLIVVVLAKPVVVIVLKLASNSLKGVNSAAGLILALGLYVVAAFAPYVVMQMIGVIGGATQSNGAGGMRQAGFGGVAGMAAGVMALTGAASKLGSFMGGGKTRTPSAAGRAAAATAGAGGPSFSAGLAALQAGANRPMLQAGRAAPGPAGALTGGGGGDTPALGSGVIPGQLTGSPNRPALPPGTGGSGGGTGGRTGGPGGGTGGTGGGGGTPGLPPNGTGGGTTPPPNTRNGSTNSVASTAAARQQAGPGRYALTAPVRPAPAVHTIPPRTPTTGRPQ